MELSRKAGAKGAGAVRTNIAGSPVPPISDAVRATTVQPAGFGTVTPSRVSAPPAKRVTVDDVRKRAYDIYLGRRASGAPGGPESDWAQAERELKVRA